MAIGGGAWGRVAWGQAWWRGFGWAAQVSSEQDGSSHRALLCRKGPGSWAVGRAWSPCLMSKNKAVLAAGAPAGLLSPTLGRVPAPQVLGEIADFIPAPPPSRAEAEGWSWRLAGEQGSAPRCCGLPDGLRAWKGLEAASPCCPAAPLILM